MALDHELKLQRALKHLQDLTAELGNWVRERHYTVRYEYEPDARWTGPIPPGKADIRPDDWRSYLGGPVYLPGQPHVPLTTEFGVGRLVAIVTAEQPPAYPLSVIVGDALHNLRSGLDVLAFALASAHAKPLPKDIADRSEFPIFGDEDRQGTTGVGSRMFNQQDKYGRPARGSGLAKIEGWHPLAQAEVERLQPYQRGNDFRSDPLWLIHDLDRISKHRLLHPVVGAFAGTEWDFNRATNIRAIGPGFIDSYGGVLQPDTRIAQVVGVQRIDPNADVTMPIAPSLGIVFGPSTQSAEGMNVVATLAELYNYAAATVIPSLSRWL